MTGGAIDRRLRHEAEPPPFPPPGWGGLDCRSLLALMLGGRIKLGHQCAAWEEIHRLARIEDAERLKDRSRRTA